METTNISFTELRWKAQQVIGFVIEEYWWEKDSSLRTSLEADLGITGTDAEEFLAAFSKRFGVDLTSLEFDKYFAYEGKISSKPIDLLLQLTSVPFLVLLLILWLCQTLLALIIGMRSKSFALRISGFSILSYWGVYQRKRWPNKHPEHSFNVGDLVASAVMGRFVKREQICFTSTPTG